MPQGSKAKFEVGHWLTFVFVQSNQLGKLQRNSLSNKSHKRLPSISIFKDQGRRAFLNFPWPLIHSDWRYPVHSKLEGWRGSGKQIEERDRSRFVIFSIPVGTTSWKGALALPFGNIHTLIMMVIHTCLADLLLKAFKILFQSLIYLEELLFFWCASINPA